MAEQRATPQEQVRALYEEAESRTASAMEELVGRDSFGELLARMTENVMAVTKIGNDLLDLFVRNLRVASRQDVLRLGRQLARTEDKLELVLQEVERLQEKLEGDGRTDGQDASAGRASRSGRKGGRSSASSSDGSRSKSGQRRGRASGSGSS